MRRQILTGCALAVVLTAGTATALATADDAARGNGCPRDPIASRNVYEALAAARRLLIHGKTVTVQGSTTTLTTRNTHIRAVVRLAREEPAVPGANALRRVATARCGQAVAQASWGIDIWYAAKLASSAHSMEFVVKTESGWKRF
jgi:hypothetical protein